MLWRKHKPPDCGETGTGPEPVGLMRAVAAVALAALLVAPLAGCELVDQHAKAMDLMRGMAADTVSRLDQGAIAQAMASGQAVEPGITAEAGVIYRVEARFSGLAGQFSSASQGTLGDRGMPADIARIVNDTSLSAEARQAAILKWLALQRASPPATESGNPSDANTATTEKASENSGGAAAEPAAPT